MTRHDPFEIAGTLVPPGQRRSVEIPVARLTTGTAMSLPVTVLRGERPGPCLWVSAVIHGDEINGLEIVRRLLGMLSPREISGTLIAVPLVNVFGFLQQSRYLPDRRDLNRSFPGSPRGSLASRLAHIFMEEIVGPATHGIDLHTASANRDNLPQIRADLGDDETASLAKAFGAPVVLHAGERDGSLRQAATKRGKRVLLYEAGEPLRFNENAIDAGLRGVRRVLHALGMARKRPSPASRSVFRSWKSRWVRAPRSGLFRTSCHVGDVVKAGVVLGAVHDPFDSKERKLRSPGEGLVVGITKIPIVHQGDALVHVALEDASPERPR